MSKKKSKKDLEALKDMAAREALIVDSNEKSQETDARMMLTGTSIFPSVNELKYSMAPSRKCRISSSARAERKNPARAGGSLVSRPIAGEVSNEREVEKAYKAVASSVKLPTR